MRSFLFIPGDSPKKLERGLGSGADALLLDLEDSISPQNKAQARAITLAFLMPQAAFAQANKRGIVKLTEEALSSAIELTADGEMRRRAAALGERIRKEKGVERAVEVIREHLSTRQGGR